MSEVRKSLNTIGLAQADAFETNDLDIDLPGQVDDQLLKVLACGRRRRSTTPATISVIRKIQRGQAYVRL
jgi:hypothetical protein